MADEQENSDKQEQQQQQSDDEQPKKKIVVTVKTPKEKETVEVEEDALIKDVIFCNITYIPDDSNNPKYYSLRT